MGAEVFAVCWCAAAWLAVAGVLAAVVASDLRCRRIPNALVIVLVAVWAALQAGLFAAGVRVEALPAAAQACGLPGWLATRLVPASFLEGLASALVAGTLLLVVSVIYERMRGRCAMGAGDVKLICALALFAGPMRLTAGLLVACVFALVAGLARRQRTFPFAPALAFGFIVSFGIGC